MVANVSEYQMVILGSLNLDQPKGRQGMNVCYNGYLAMEAVDHEPYCVPLVGLSSQPVLPPTVYLAVFSEDILIRKQAMV